MVFHSEPADALTLKGEFALLRGDLQGLDFFDQALASDPLNEEMHYRQGLALFEFGSEEEQERYLHLACKRFHAATQIKADYCDAWATWGSTLFLLAEISDQHHYFFEAKEKFLKAFSMKSNEAELLWNIGRVCLMIAQESQEVSDAKEALDALERASSLQESHAGEFYSDMGKAYLLMSQLVRDMRLLVKAIHAFKRGVSLALNSSEGWKNLAGALERLYLQTHEDDHYTQASECFAAAVHLHPLDGGLWLHWAQFLLESGRRSRDEKRLNAALEKCRQSAIYLPKHPHVLATKAQILALIGELTERVDFLYEAENTMNEALDIAEDDPLLWHAFGMCYVSFAHYFEDPDYFFQAIEKLQWSLSLDRTLHVSWSAMAQCYSAASMIFEDMEYLEKSVRFYAKAEALSPSAVYFVNYAIALTQLGEMKDEPSLFEEAIRRFEWALSQQKNALYSHPEWLFYYAVALDLIGDHQDEKEYYLKSIELLSHVMMVDPDFPHLHQRLGLVFTHLAEFTEQADVFYRALHHFRLAHRQEPESDFILLDWGVCLLNLSQHIYDTSEREMVFREAQNKLMQSARLGNVQSYYHLACLYALIEDYEKAIYFLGKGSRAKSLPPVEEILEDEWLDGLRSTSSFQEFLTQLEKR